MISSVHIIIGLIAICNIIAFALVYFDKQKSIAHAERVPEVSFFIWSIFFASLGVLAGMFVFHHKTRKLNFVFGIGLLAIEQIALTYAIIQWL